MLKFLKPLFFLFAFFTLSYNSFAQIQTYSDVPSNDPNYAAIEYLSRPEVGIFKGYADGIFGLKQEMNRAELMTIVTRSLNINPDPSLYKNCFNDVKTEWFAPAVCYAKAQEWVEGFPDGSFSPSIAVNEAEALKIILRPFFAEEIDSQTDSDINYYNFRDMGEEWQKKYISFANSKNLLQYFYAPEAPRAEVAEILFRAKLTLENDWVSFTPFLRDHYLLTHDLGHLFGDATRCYYISDSKLITYAADNKAIPFIRPYLESLYGELDVALYDFKNKKRVGYSFPYLDLNQVCIESDHEILYLSKIQLAEDEHKTHFTQFDLQGNILFDSSAICENAPTALFQNIEGISFGFGTQNLDDFETIECR